MKLCYLLLIALPVLTGCQAHQKTSLPATGQAIARAQALGELAQQQVEKVVPHVSGEDKANLETAANALTVQAGAHAIALREDNGKTLLVTELTIENTQMKTAYFSPRQKRQWHWFIGLSLTALLLWFVGGLLIRFTTGGLSTFLLRFLPATNLFVKPGK